jgi:hypothetical protein
LSKVNIFPVLIQWRTFYVICNLWIDRNPAFIYRYFEFLNFHYFLASMISKALIITKAILTAFLDVEKTNFCLYTHIIAVMYFGFLYKSIYFSITQLRQLLGVLFIDIPDCCKNLCNRDRIRGIWRVDFYVAKLNKYSLRSTGQIQ